MRLVSTVVVFFALSFAAAAATVEEAFPIQLEAGSMEIDKKSGHSVYRGNVVLTRGPVTINADIMTVITAGEEVERIVAKGQPVKFEQLPGADRKSVKGQANTIEYEAKTKTVLLTENAELWQEQDRFIGESIRYDMDKETVTAGKAESGGRVKVVIHPKNEAAQKPVPEPAQ